MGEIFKVEKSSTPLGFTGERFTTAVSGQIELEHLHRYLMARTLCRGKHVVDVACGEGYGAALLAQVARRIIGVELDQTTVAHAAESYKRPNLRFICGDARRIPLPDASADVVTSFETLEHFLEHKDFFREVHRILRPEGFLLISTPDCDVYSPSGRAANPFHVRELSRDEFLSQLTTHFPVVSVFRQRPLVGSLIAKVNREPTTGRLVTYDKRDESHYEENIGLARALYLIAIASKTPSMNLKTFSSVLIDTDRVDLQAAELGAAKAAAQREISCLQENNLAARSEITQLQSAHATALSQISELQEAKVTALGEITQLQSLYERLIAEGNALRASWSWRVTKPIRGLCRRFPQLARLVKSLPHISIYPLRRAALLLAKKRTGLALNSVRGALQKRTNQGSQCTEVDLTAPKVAPPRNAVFISVLAGISATIRSHLSKVGVVGTVLSVYRSIRASGLSATAFLISDKLFQRPQLAACSGPRVELGRVGRARSLRSQVTLIGTLNLPQCRKYRVIQRQEMIERVTGTLVTVSSYHDILRSLTSMQTASKLVLYRVPSGPEFQKIIAEARRLSIEVCYDIDDPVFDLETVRANPNLDYLPRRIKKALLSDAALFKEAMQQCDLITVSTPGLKDLVERNFGNVRCRVVQNGVDTETLHVASVVRHRRNACLADGFRIVLASGSLAHGADTQVAAEGIRQFLDSHPQTEVNTIGHVAAGFALRNHKRVREFPQMAYAEYMRVLSEANAALVPLAPGTFNDCKSIVRLIDATAVGVPVIASPVGEYAEPGVSSSYLSARSPDDWCSALETLASDRVATTRVTQNARRHTYNERLLPVIWNRTDPLVQQFFVSKDIRSAPDMIQTASD